MSQALTAASGTRRIAACSSVQSKAAAQLATCAWVSKGEPLCLIDDSGTGKSHLLIGLGVAAAMAGHRVK